MDISEKDLKRAKEVYADLCAMLDADDWNYQKEEDKLKISFGAQGEDIPMKFIMFIDPNPGLIRLLSWLPFEINSDHLIDAAVATCAINYMLKNGTFDFNIDNGMIGFRLTQAYFDSSIGEDVLKYMVYVSAHTVDEFNDKYMNLSKGTLSLKAFLEEINQ